ncbi:MAG: histidine ammonia-lyase [Flavobacteriales bacterium]|nr:histidine ammonia-lyase [Flavobacteriales bacterium]
MDIRRSITPEEVYAAASSHHHIQLDESALTLIRKARHFLDGKSLGNGSPIYGVNTGFGSLCNTVIPDHDLGVLQRNLLVSHACGAGEEVPEIIVRMMLLLKIRGLSYGHSGVDESTVLRLIDFFNLGITPVVYQQGSLGASGDLAPLAHLCLPLIGEGEVYWKGEKVMASVALKACGLQPLTLKSKEGLALINGTQFMSAYAVWCVVNAGSMLDTGLRIAAMSLDAFDGRPEPFDPAIHHTRPHTGQIRVAEKMLDYLSGSELIQKKKEHVQDPYSFRCIPQVIGASLDSIDYIRSVIRTEINAVTDNPVIIPDEDKVISGGNFHGQPLALVLDFLAIAMAECGCISERRVYKLISGQRGLPPYLAPDAGLNSGFMIPQYTAASIVSQNKQWCTPASVDTIDSSNGQEDHVSMGANAATKCYRVIENVRSIFAIELFTAAQALEFRRPAKSSQLVEQLHAKVRSIAPFLAMDELMSGYMRELKKLI